ncbi:MAG TPA: ATPase, T2SS/T4P/T4SS family, partial [Candidatus Omnitrophota bacterium]|nr:ATPase, T2SS/T4P/T4SS family [Candidatus Omnitrophota bacterium]
MMHYKIGEILLQQKLITEDQLQDAIAMQKRDGGRVGENLIKLGYLTEEDIVSALAAQLDLPYATPENELLNPDVSQDLDKVIPYDFAKRNIVLPIARQGNVITVALEDPLDLVILDNLKMLAKDCEIRLLLATRKSLLPAIQEFYSLCRTARADPGDNVIAGDEETPGIEIENEEFTPPGSTDTNVDELIEKAEEAPVIKLVDLMIQQAIEQRASDIHIEPFKDKISVRYRIDGLLYQIPPPNRHLMLPIVSRLKILSKLDIAEKRLPQDGAISFKYNDRFVD